MKAYRGFEVRREYSTKVALKDEDGGEVPKGTLLRIVAIAAKVRMVKADGVLHDGLEYFYNAVRADEADWWEHYYGSFKDKPIGKRIRANFVTLKK